jgi:hypothetical protein
VRKWTIGDRHLKKAASLEAGNIEDLGEKREAPSVDGIVVPQADAAVTHGPIK